MHIHSAAEEKGPFWTYTQPTKSMAAKIKPKIKDALDGIIRRATAKLNISSIPAVFRWELVGQTTQWALIEYQKPRSPAALELLDDIIALAADVLKSKDVALIEDKELVARLTNATKLHGLVRHYLDHLGAPPAMEKFVDLAAEAAQGKGKLDASDVALMVVDATNQTGGPALAELFSYVKEVNEGKEAFDLARYFDMQVPVLSQFGAPPAVADYLRTSADMARRRVVADPTEESIRAQRTMAEAARQLQLPPAIAEAIDYAANVTGNFSKAQASPKPDEIMKVLSHFNSLQAKLNDQLDGPAAISQLILRLGAPTRGRSPPDAAEVLGLIAKATREVSLPTGLAEFLEYMSSVSAAGAQPDSARVQEILLKLNQQIDAPDALIKFGKDYAASADRSGGSLDPAKLSRMVTLLLRRLELPAFAEVFAKVVGPLMTKGKSPDPLSLAIVAPSFLKVMPDFGMAANVVRDLRAKILRPLLPVYNKAFDKLTGSMPDSPLKSAIQQALSVSRPSE